jgi:hypothetical protein
VSRSLFAILALAMVLVSCQQPTSSSLEAKQAAQLVMPLQAAVASLSLGTKLAPDAVATTDSTSRSLTPGNLSTTSGGTSEFDANILPSVLYATSTSTATTRRFPATGYYYDAASAQADRQYYFSLTPYNGSATRFTVQLFTYPLADFTVSYVAETYVVDDANAGSSTSGVWAWTPENNAGTLNQENSNVTYYTDGTNDGGSTILATSKSSSPVVYGPMHADIASSTSVYADPTVAADYANYTFPSSFTNVSSLETAFGAWVPNGTMTTGTDYNTTWSSKTLVSTSNLNRLTYYTELGTTASPYQKAYGLVLSTTEPSGSGNYARTVTRYLIDFPNKTQTVRALTVAGAKWTGGSNISRFLAVKTNVGQTAGGLVTVDQSQQLWYASSASTMNTTVPSEYLGLTLTQQAANSSTYTGTMYWLWNGSGNVYSVTEANGLVHYQWTGATTLAAVTGTGNTALTANPRSVTSTPSFLSSSVSLPVQAYGTKLSIAVNGGTFEGTFDGTQFDGQFVYGTSSTAVTVSATGITAAGTTFAASDLLN